MQYKHHTPTFKHSGALRMRARILNIEKLSRWGDHGLIPRPLHGERVLSTAFFCHLKNKENDAVRFALISNHLNVYLIDIIN